MAKSTGLSFTKAELVDLSESMSDSEIGNLFGVTASNIKYWRNKLEIETRYERHKVTISKIKLFDLAEKYSDPEIASMLNVTSNAILYWRKKHGILAKHRLKRFKTHDVDEDFFSEISTEEQAYTLGFLAGDGNIHPRNRSFSIAIHEKDMDVLLKIRDAMKGNMPILTSHNEHGFGNSESRIAILNVCRAKMVRDLNRLGFYPNKSLTIRFPEIPKQIERHFIRGLWDADGHFAKTGYQFGLSGASPLVLDVRDKIFQHTSRLLYLSTKKCRSLFGSGNDRPAIQWIYKDATIYLDRKYKLYLKHWQ